MTPFRSRDASGNHARFAAAHAARSLGWGTTDLLLAWHLHIVVGLSGAAVSLLLTIFLSIGALANFGVGYWLTARGATAPAYVRLQLFGAVAAAVLLAGQFLVRDPILVAIVGIAFRIAFAVQDVPQTALGSLLPVGDCDVQRYARLRVMLSGASRVVAIAVHLTLLHLGHPGAGVLALVAIGGLIVASALGLRGLRFPAAPRLRSAAPGWPTPWPDGLPRLLLAFAAAAALLPTISRLLIFMPAIGAQAYAGSWMLAAFCTGSVAGPVLQRRLARVLGDGATLMAGLVIVATSAVFVLFAIAFPLRVVATALHGIGLSVIGVHLWATAARVALRDAEDGPRRDGLVASAVIITTHLSMAFGSLLLAPLIDAYEAGDPDAALAALLIVGGGAAAILSLSIRRRTTPAMA